MSPLAIEIVDLVNLSRLRSAKGVRACSGAGLGRVGGGPASLSEVWQRSCLASGAPARDKSRVHNPAAVCSRRTSVARAPGAHRDEATSPPVFSKEKSS